MSPYLVKFEEEAVYDGCFGNYTSFIQKTLSNETEEKLHKDAWQRLKGFVNKYEVYQNYNLIKTVFIIEESDLKNVKSFKQGCTHIMIASNESFEIITIQEANKRLTPQH